MYEHAQHGKELTVEQIDAITVEHYKVYDKLEEIIIKTDIFSPSEKFKMLTSLQNRIERLIEDKQYTERRKLNIQ